MSLLNFEPSSPERTGKKRSLKVVFGVGAIAAVMALGSTFAANINLNGGDNVEFGQGVTRTVACDSDGITLTPYSTFINAPGAGEHAFSSLKVSGIDSSLDKCAGKTFLIKAYGESGPALDLFKWESRDTPQSEWEEVDRYDFIEIKKDADEFTWISDGTDDDDVISETDDITETSFTLLFTSEVPSIRRTPLASAQDIKRITIETYDQGLLDNRVVSTSQFGVYIPSVILEDGLPTALGGPLDEGNYIGTVCTEPLCYAYTTFDEMINDLTVQDMVNINADKGTDLTRSDLSSATTLRFNYDPSADEGERWSLTPFLFGQQDGDTTVGEVMGFNGNTGVFLGDGGPSGIGVFFSLNGALTSTSVIGTFTPYGDQPLRTLPIRNFREIWDGSESSYNE
jgi:hypothetical protein